MGALLFATGNQAVKQSERNMCLQLPVVQTIAGTGRPERAAAGPPTHKASADPPEPEWRRTLAEAGRKGGTDAHLCEAVQGILELLIS